MKKKLFSMFLLLVFVFVLAACGDTLTTVNQTTDTTQTTTIDVVTTQEPTSTEEETLISVTSIFVNADLGSGSIDDPYVVTTSIGSTVSVAYSVRPTQASNNSFTWVSGAVVDSTFSPGVSSVATLVDENGKLAFTGNEEGNVIFKGTADDGSGVEAYVAVNVETYIALESIIINGLELVDGDYNLVTSLGSKWNMTGDEIARKDSLINGEIFSGLQAPSNLTYWPTLNNLGIEVLPVNASDPTLIVDYSVEDIVQVDVNSGDWTAVGAGTTVVTISSYADSSIFATINVEVKDTLYKGILASVYDETDVSSFSEWNFDADHGSETQLAKINEWNLVMAQTTTNDSSELVDNNQKAFYLGAPERIYGIDLESHLTDDGDISSPTALMWNKIALSDTVTSLDILLGPNDKLIGEFRILMVDELGTVYVLQDNTGFTAPNTSVRFSEIQIPEDLRGQTVALVIESYVTERNTNVELQVKGLWINEYTEVTEVVLPETSGTYGQGSTFNLNASVLPENATYRDLVYTIDQTEQGVVVDEDGQVTLALDAVVGDYVITVTSVDNDTLLATYTLSVIEFTETTSFAISGIEDGETILATYGLGGYGSNQVSFTDSDKTLNFEFNSDASIKTYDVVTTGTSASLDNGVLKINSVGLTTFTVTATGTELSVTFSVDVKDYETSKIVEGLPEASVVNKDASSTTVWDDAETLSEWYGVLVDTSHSNSKVPGVDNSKILFESHSTSANLETPISFIWNKVLVGETINSLVLNVRSHDDDRILEGSNFRVLVLSGDGFATQTELISWTSVASRWSVKDEPFTLALDVSQFAGEEVIILVESAGSLQNNGNYPLNSNSAAGGYLHLQGIALSDELAPSLDSQYTYRLYAFTSDGALATDWNALSYFKSANRNGGLYDESGNYMPLVVEYSGPLDAITSLTLPMTSIFVSNGTDLPSPILYPWGLYPALNNAEDGIEVTYDIIEGDSVSLVDGVLTPLALGDTLVKMGIRLLNSESFAYFTFTVSVVEKQVIIDPPTETTEWLNKDDITEDWTLVGQTDAGIGEGADLIVGSEPGWSAWVKEVTLTDVDQLTFSARVFHRDGETYPEFVIKVNEQVIRALGATEDYVYVDTDDFQFFTYDLSAFEGQTVTIQVGITIGTHAVVGSIVLGQLNETTAWNDKDSIVEDWILTGNADLGVGEGGDLVVGTEVGWSSWGRDIFISEDTARLSFDARVFHRDGETYPEFVIKVDGQIVQAIGRTEEFVYVDTDDFQTFSYDLSQFAGDYHFVEVGITIGTHAVVGAISLSRLNEGVSWMDKDSIVEDWILTGNADLGVGEGGDLVVGSETGWSSWGRPIYINETTEILTFTARVFHRDGETYPEFVIKVDGQIVRAIGASENFVYVDTDDFQEFQYDLSGFAGDVHFIEVGITIGTHAVVGSIEFSENQEVID